MLKDYTMTPNRAGIPVWRPAQPVIGREDEHQTALTNWARMMRTQYPALRLYHHIPNGGLRDKRTAARLIGQGVLIGVPDVFIPTARGDYHGIYVELKVGHNQATPVQNEYMAAALRELDEYKKAEAEGRLVVPPCKVGSMIYRFQRYFDDATLTSKIKIKPCVVESVSTKCIITTDHVVMLFSDFGKTVFLTHEEAEKALEGNNGQKR